MPVVGEKSSTNSSVAFNSEISSKPFNGGEEARSQTEKETRKETQKAPSNQNGNTQTQT